MSSRGIAGSRTIYVGNLPNDVREREVEELFQKYGRIVDIDLKLPPRPPGFAFVEFEDARDAQDAVQGRDGYEFDGNKLRVEIAHGGSARGSRDRYGEGFVRPGASSARGQEYDSRGAGGRGMSRRSEFRVVVTGLPSSASWQDLKDHMRKAGEVEFAQVFRQGSSGAMGIVDFTNAEDMRHAIKKLDDSEFRNPFGRGYIRVKEDRGGGMPSARSRSPTRSRSRSRSPARRSRTRSRSKSPASRSPSPSKSRSRSPKRPARRDSRDRSESPDARRPSRAARDRSPDPDKD